MQLHENPLRLRVNVQVDEPGLRSLVLTFLAPTSDDYGIGYSIIDKGQHAQGTLDHRDTQADAAALLRRLLVNVSYVVKGDESAGTADKLEGVPEWESLIDTSGIIAGPRSIGLLQALFFRGGGEIRVRGLD